MAKKDIKFGTALLIAHIVSSVKPTPKTKSADELIKQVNTDSFKRRCFTKVSGLKNHSKEWRDK